MPEGVTTLVESNVCKKARKILREIGVPPYMRGFGYAIRAIELLNKEPWLSMMQLYNIIGNEYTKTPQTVTTALLVAIRKANPESEGYKKYKAVQDIENQSCGNMLRLLLCAVQEMDDEISD